MTGKEKGLLKVCLVGGARPNFMKISPIWAEMKKFSAGSDRPDRFHVKIVHTGQHYDYKMSKVFFEDLELPKPDVYLGVGSGTHADQTARIMIQFEKTLLSDRPDLVMVVGDVNSTLACTLVAAKVRYNKDELTPYTLPPKKPKVFRGLHLKRPIIAHVEAGLRSFDRTMPEEINRIVTDTLSDLLFTSCRDADENLKREGIAQEKVYFVGNVMIDSLLKHQEKAQKSDILQRLQIKEKGYCVLTLHRPSNVDNPETLSQIIDAVGEISRKIPVVFPAHPRTQQYLAKLPPNLYDSITLLNPIGYLDFLRLMGSARLVLTDSGGIQEETTCLGIPCLTLRENTERPVTITQGTNRLVGTAKSRILEEATSVLNRPPQRGSVPELWDGKASSRIVKVLREQFWANHRGTENTEKNRK